MLPSGVTFTAEKGNKMTISTAHLCCVAAGEKGTIAYCSLLFTNTPHKLEKQKLLLVDKVMHSILYQRVQ